MTSRIQIRRDTASNWTSADPVLAEGEIGFECDTKKSKIGDGSSAWTALGYVIEEPFSATEKAKLAGIQPGAQLNTVDSVHGRTGVITAQPNDYKADQITDTPTKKIMTVDERSKLASIEDRAQVNTVASVHGRTGVITAQPNDYKADQITDTPTKKIMTVDERSKLALIEERAQVNTVASVHGRTGVVTAQPNDYKADQITDTPTKKIMTVDERSKLASIEDRAQVNPARAADGDVVAGIGTTVACFTPAQLKLAAQTFGAKSLINPLSPLGDALTQGWIGSYQDAQTGLKNVIAYIHGSYFRAYHIDQTVVATPVDVPLPAAVDAGLTDVKKMAFIFHGSSRPGLAGAAASQKFTATEQNSLKIDLPSNTTVRLDPSHGRAGITGGARAVCSVVSNVTTANDPYYCWSLGNFEVTVASRRSFIKQTLASASLNGWAGTLTAAQWKKCIVIPGWNSAAAAPRRLGPPPAWLPDPANVVVHSAIAATQAGSIYRFQIVCFEGSAWKVHHAYGLSGTSTADEADFVLRDTPPLANFQVPHSSYVSLPPAAAGTGYAVNDILTPAATGWTGTLPTFRVSAIGTGGAVTAVVLETPGDFTASPDSPVATTVTRIGGGGGTGCTLIVGASAVFTGQGASSAVADWSRAAILSGLWRGTHFAAAAKLGTDAHPLWLPGFGGGTEGSVPNAVRYRFAAAHSNAHEAGYAYVLEDAYSAGTSARRMLVTRFDTTSTAASPPDIDITSAALPSTADAIVIGRSVTTANQVTAGFDQGCVGWLLVSPTALRIVRENAEVGTFAGRAEVIRLPRREIV